MIKKLFSNIEPDELEFTPPIIRLQASPPHPLRHKVIWTLLLTLTALLIWAAVGKLDIVAVADGKLVPQTYVKIVQPSEAGIIKDILVNEGEHVKAGQVLIRMDTLITDADAVSIQTEFSRKKLALQRIDAELAGGPFKAAVDAPVQIINETKAQFDANRAAFNAALAEERSRLQKAQQDLLAAEQVRDKLKNTLPHYRKMEVAFDKLVKEGAVAEMEASDKRRERIEKEQELRAQEHVMESAKAGVSQSEKTLAQIESDYRRQLYKERSEIANAVDRLDQELTKQIHRQDLLELKAPQAGIVKDLATHTRGAVVQPGTVLLTLVPHDETLRAEIWVSNEDIGFVRIGQPVKLKFMAFPFQKYGMAEGTVEYISADANDPDNVNAASGVGRQTPFVYKTLITLKSMDLEVDGKLFPLTAGMRTNAEILLGARTVAEYLLSPVQKAWHESGRER